MPSDVTDDFGPQTIAIAISSNVYNRIDGVGRVGGIIGTF